MSPTATAGAAPKFKRSARNYLLDSRFQLKYTGFLVLVAIAISGLTGSVLYSTARAMVDESAATAPTTSSIRLAWNIPSFKSWVPP